MGRKRRTSVGDLMDALPINYITQPVEVMCPTLHKVATSNEVRLLDLASIQLELERVLTNTMERLQCLSAEAKGKRIPTAMLQSLQQQSATADAPTNSGRPSLVVKANPNKPLTLIISQQNRPIQSQPPVPVIPKSPGSSRVKYFPSPVGLRKVNRYSHKEQADQSSPISPDKNQNASAYAIPNKFWELMEPYCAELTEANISFLESLVRSYQDMEATYFQLPPLRSPEASKVECSNSPAHKRPRREAVRTNNHGCTMDAVTNSDEPSGIFTASSSVQRAQILEAELRNPISESSALGKLSLSLLSSCYQETILFGFAERVKRLSDESDKHFRTKPTDATHSDRDAPSAPSSPNESTLICDHCPGLFASSTASHSGMCNPWITLPDEIRHWVTPKACQPLKVLAKQIRVSSSYRVEKKISQAMAELGLIPLNVMHPLEPSTSVPVHPHVKLEDHFASKSTSGTTISEDKVAPKSQEVTYPSRHSTTAMHVNAGCKSHSCMFRAQVHSPSKPDPSTAGVAERGRSPVSGLHANSVAANNPPSSNFKANNQPCTFPTRDLHRSIRKRRLRVTLHSDPSTVTQNGYPCGTKHAGDYGSNCDSPECNGALSSDDGLDVSDKVCTGSPSACEHSSAGKRMTPYTSSRPTGTDEDDCSSSCSLHNTPHTSQTEVNGMQPVKVDEAPSTLVNGDVPNSNQLLGDRRFTLTAFGSNAPETHSNAVLNHFSEARWVQDASAHTSKSCDDKFLHSVDAQPNAVVGYSDPDGGRQPDAAFCLHEIGHHQDIQHTSSTIALPPVPENGMFQEMPGDELGRAILQRQRELRVVCAENHSVLRRLIQAARRDMQRQEIQRRLAIADADVIEAYNRLESYRPQRKPPLKRDRDSAYKALRERCKILKELEAFDAKPP